MESSISSKNNMRRKYHKNILGEMFGPFSFINVFSGKEGFVAENGMKNMVEVAVVVKIVQLLYKECSSSKHSNSISVLSPYPAHVQCMLTQLGDKYQNNEFFKVKVGILGEYEGEQVDVVIISTVGAHEDDEMNMNLTNPSVYFSWARQCLWILGDARVHLKGGSMWKSLILEAQGRQCFFQADEHKDLTKVIVEVKKDLHQLDELLSRETTLFRSTTWKVLFSRMFRTSFSKIKSWETKKLVLLMLLKLSSGWRPKRSCIEAFASERPYCDLMKEFKVKELHLICTIDIVKETHYTQVLKVWDILPFHEISELVERLKGIIGIYTQEYIDRCKIKCGNRGSEFPMKWPPTSKIIQYKTDEKRPCDEMFVDDDIGSRCVENVKVSESLLLMKFFPFSTRTVNNMISGSNGGDLGLPFELTDQEKDVVSFDKSSFILGRSGTGKTTVLTTKLFQNEQLHHLACEGFHEVMEKNEVAKQDVLHQLFVTFSPKLCYAVKQHLNEWKRLTCIGSSSTLKSSVRIDDIEERTLSEDIPDHFIHIPNDAYPLIITLNRFLLMLDATLGTSFFERFPYDRQLVCGYQSSTSRLVVLEEYMRDKDVTYERFCSSYWPHFNNKLTKNLDPSTIYTEIISVIKGGLTAENASDGILSLDDYVALCDGRISIFDAEKRKLAYAIFLQYEKKKVENGNFDLPDLVNDLHQRLQVEGYKGDIMDYIFIDEVQDLSMRQIMLFKYVCPNVHEGFAFSGDTAQAIAKGVGFRFEDIRCLFFKRFLSGSEKGKMSPMFQLSENFRTHAGVLNLAQSVIDILYHFFPLFIDALSPETSRIGGDLPVLLETEINNNAMKIIFERKGDISHEINGFGANQVILVRNESHKEKVVNIVGKNAIVLTIMESKGLEFEVVLLYDFFTTSSFSNEWRIIYDFMKEKDILNSTSTALCPSFDMEKHAVLCSELKQLYVAVTRTRQRLWICEATGFSHPLYDYWQKLSLVEVKHLSAKLADEMRIPSSKEEWRSRGIKLFNENNFRMAQLCFLKVGDKHSERLAEAYDLRAIAGDARSSYPDRRKLFNDAAKLFISIDKKELAAECFYDIQDYRTAGDIYFRESMWVKAGNCFYLAKCYKLAVEAYMNAGAVAKCFSACSEGKLFEIGFELIGRWGECGSVEQEFLHKGALHFFTVKDFKSMIKFVRSFRSKVEMRDFLTQKRCYDELLMLEKQWGNNKEIAKVAYKGALHFFTVKDFKSMIKFVRSFRSKVEMRNFLTQKRCYDELLMLEKEWGNKEEIAKVAYKGALHFFTVKDFKTMIKFIRSFRSKVEMRNFLTQKRCYDELLMLEKKWGNNEEIAKVAYKGACYYFSVNNFEHMMKFVRSFRSKDEMRSFLTGKRRLDELILLEKDWGNFEEAAKVARLKPDPVLEADLLHTGGFHKESSLILLWHVFLKSPSFQSAEEPFIEKDELLTKAVSIAKQDSDILFYRFVCKEANILSEGETKEELLKKCVEFVYYYKDNSLAVRLERVKTSQAIKKIEKNVLDMMRSFLKSVNRVNELLLLDEVCGEFVEAAKISQEDDHSIEATLRRLWYIFFGSLWAQGKKAWPLKDFTQKYKLLDDANSYVNKDHLDSQDSVLLNTEISVLSGAELSLLRMWMYLIETPRERSVRLHFLISRRLLDVHLLSHCMDYSSTEPWVEDATIKDLEGVFSDEIVSVEGLIYFWNFWKDLIWELIKWSYTRYQGCKNSKMYKDFMSNYFGVRQYDGDSNGSYVVLDVEAQWVKEMKPFVVRNGYLYILCAHQFSSVASQYWCSELLSVAEEVLIKLQSLLCAYSTDHDFSMHQQTKILISLFEVAKSLQKCNFLYGKNHASAIVDQYIQPCVDHFLSNVFHIDWKYAQSKDMVSLRGNVKFLNTLKESIDMSMKLQKDLTCWQRGRMAMVLLGYKLISFNADTERKVRCCYPLNWRGLFSKLMNGDKSSSKNGDLAISLHNVLVDAGRRRFNDSMSPACFLYLMERLLILSFCYRGYVYTTRSSCVEWLAYEAWGLGSIGGGVTRFDTMKNIHNSLASLASEMLSSKEVLMECLRKSKELESSHSVLVLRLFVLLSLLCANSGRHYYDNLFNLLGHTHFDSLLPPVFREVLIKGIKEECLVEAVAVACEGIDNPLVIVSFTQGFPKSPSQNAIFLNMTTLDFSQEMAMEVLYPEKCDDASTSSHDHGAQESDFPLLSN